RATAVGQGVPPPDYPGRQRGKRGILKEWVGSGKGGSRPISPPIGRLLLGSDASSPLREG
ncbi:MAG: hypothetical protein ACJ8KA_04355, partial [Sulfurifustis sp.]